MVASAAPLRRRLPAHGLLAGAVFLGGAVGGALRAVLERTWPATPGHWPWVTFSVNVVGSALLAFFVTRLQERLPPSSYRRPLLGTGFCGALTTFSTLQLEEFQLLRAGDGALAAAYLGASCALGFGAVFLVTQLVRRARLR